MEMNDHILDDECEKLAVAAIEEADQYHEGDIDTADEILHGMVDGHEWVIYHYKSVKVCANCRIDDGEAFLAEVGMPEDDGMGRLFFRMASAVAYGEMMARARGFMEETFKEREAA